MRIGKEIIEKKFIIYKLLKEWTVVYVWQSSKWLKRVFNHFEEKDFDEVEILDAPENIEEREKEESVLIDKYNPKYNITNNTTLFNLKENGFISLRKVREHLRDELKEKSFNVTNTLKRDVKKNCETRYNNTAIYVKKTDLMIFIIKKYNIYIKF